jgi:glycosyltransferase involved in cell wall biosynthesis
MNFYLNINSMNKKFVTIFPNCENVHLTKDLGQIPYFMYAKHDYNARIATYRNSEEYDAIYTEVKGLKIDFIDKIGTIWFLEKGVLKYIYNKAKNIEVLNLFHFSKWSFVYGILFKLLNPKGFLFLKLDAYNKTFSEGTKIIHSRKKIKNFFILSLEKYFLKKVDLITIENKEGERLVKLMYPKLISKIMYLPVGVNDIFLKKEFGTNLKTFEEKENIILTTGRIGAEVKNHQMLLKAITNINLQDWKMVFVGPVEEEFMNFVDSVFAQNPQLKSKIVFTGEISNRKELYEWYNRSKIFCMTSFNESFSLSVAEALYFGNYIIGTEGVMSMQDVTDNQKYGSIIKNDDDKELSVILQKLINNQVPLQKLYPSIIKHSHQNFVWSTITDNLQNRIKKN